MKDGGSAEQANLFDNDKKGEVKNTEPTAKEKRINPDSKRVLEKKQAAPSKQSSTKSNPKSAPQTQTKKPTKEQE